jgi:hypothetical protein
MDVGSNIRVMRARKHKDKARAPALPAFTPPPASRP